MKKLLSLVLSVSLLVNMAAPSFAQILQVGRGVVGRAVAADFERQLAETVLKSSLEEALVRGATTSVQQVRVQFAQGKFDDLGNRILTLPNLSVRPWMMRNEMVVLSFHKALTPQQQFQTIKVYKQSLADSKAVFASIPKTETLSSFLKKANAADAAHTEKVLGVFSDAAALGLIGSKKDIPALLDFYHAASEGIFKEVAEVTVARSLLRFQAYEELNAFIVDEKPQGVFWMGLREYCKEKGIALVNTPVIFHTEQAVLVGEDLYTFLKKGSPFASLQADFSKNGTEIWMNLGRNIPFAPRSVKGTDPSSKIVKSLQPEVAPAAVIPTLTLSAPLTTPVQQGNSVVSAGTTPISPKHQNLFKKIFRKNFDRSTFPVSVMQVNGENYPMPATFSIGSSLGSSGYDRIVFRENPRFDNGYIVEMHDHGKEPIQMEHFYMALYNNEVGELVSAAQKAGVSLRLKLEKRANVSYEMVHKTVYDETTGAALPLEVDVQLSKPLWTRELNMAFSHWAESVGLPASYNPNALADAKLVLRTNGEIWMQRAGAEGLEPLPEGYYVRLPKNQIKNFVNLAPYVTDGHLFNVVLSPTSNRVNMVARDASLTNVSLGKTMGSVVNGSLGIAESDAKSLMFSINYVLPGFASLLTPILKKYGEKNLLSLSLVMSVASGALATAGGFYGFVEQMALSPVQKGLFISALVLMSGASIIKQLVTNMLIRANRGEVVLSDSGKKASVQNAEQEISLEGLDLIKKRFKEFFTKKSDISLRAIADYNMGFVWKNVGTLAFLGSPYLISHGAEALLGVDLGLDYSISFPLYAMYSSYVMWKVLRSKLRDAYTAKNLLQSQQMLANMLETGSRALAENKVTATVIDDVARSFKDSLDALAFAHVKVDPSKEKKLFYKDAKEQILADLENNLVKTYQLPAADAKALVERVAASIKVQENTLGNMWKMIKAPGVAALTSAMTLATIHEFVISSSFSGMMKELISQGEFANFLVASSLYIPFIIGRLGGNWISRRISPDTMYIFCSALSALGTTIMATAGESVAQTITGAAVASLGVGNFFTQMYDYIMTKYPKQNREISSILALTMGVAGIGAIPAGYVAGQMGFGLPLDLMYAGVALGASLLLTPGMMVNSSLVKGISGAVANKWTKFKKFFGFGKTPNDMPPLDPTPAQ